MNEIVKRDILDILDSVPSLLAEGDVRNLKELSNHTIHNSSVFQDKDSVIIAVTVYSLYKLVENGTEVTEEIISRVREASEAMQKDNLKNFRKGMKDTIRIISSMAPQMKNYISDVLKSAHVKKSGKIYDHGISMAQAASILGVSQWDLMRYVGMQRTPDERGGIDVKKRLKLVESLFGIR